MHRTNPIRDTFKHIPGFPDTLVLFQIGGSHYWWVRAFVNGRMHKRSTKCETLGEAQVFAKDFYRTLLTQPAKPKQSNFLTVAEDLLKTNQLRVDRGERKQSVVKDLRIVLKADLSEFFGKYDVKDINYALMLKYLEHIKNKKLSNQTLKNRISYLKKILRHGAKTLNYQLPVFPEITVRDNPRPWLNEDEYALLLKAIRQAIKDKVKVRYTTINLRLFWVVQFFVNSFMRPGEISQLRFRDVSIRKQEGKPQYLKLILRAKVDTAEIITKPAAVEIFEEHLFMPGVSTPDDFVFFPDVKDRTEAQDIISRQFTEVLKMAGLKTDTEGKDRSLYSLRHTCIMRTMLEGSWDIATVAANARSSVDILMRFYVSHLKAEMLVHGIDKGVRGNRAEDRRLMDHLLVEFREWEDAQADSEVNPEWEEEARRQEDFENFMDEEDDEMG
jgi:integrase